MDKKYFIHCLSRTMESKLPDVDMSDKQWLDEAQGVIVHILGRLSNDTPNTIPCKEIY